MNSDDAPIPKPTFHGLVQNASYADQLLARYSGIPTIEALPPIRSSEDTARLLAHYPEKQPGSQKLPPELRMHLIMDAVHFFEPLPVHIDLEQRISRVIRDGYVGRNPLARDHWHEIDQRVETILKAGGIPMRTSNVIGFSIVGMSGIGKTTSVERILLTYPQVIHHQAYGGQPFSRIQVVWLKLTCPHDGSIKGLCLNFFREVDGLLGTRHYRDYAREGHRTVDELIPNMCRVAWIHCLGVLVIDEIQHLNQAKSGGAEKMLNFFLQLMNTLGVPIILIGTYAAMEILSRELRQIRRNCGQGDLIWDRMANDDVWRLFVESLWRYQHTKTQVPLGQELSDALYYESAGIIDFAVKLFLLAQVRAISTGVEKVTPAILASVAKDSLRLAQPALRALRTGDMRAVGTMSDLHPIDFESAVQQVRKAELLQNLSSGTQMVSDINATIASPPNSRALASTTPNDNTEMAPRQSARPSHKARRGEKTPDTSKCLLVQVANAGLAKNATAHDALARAGLINPLFECQNSNPSL
jgi:hypothetical protein